MNEFRFRTSSLRGRLVLGSGLNYLVLVQGFGLMSLCSGSLGVDLY